MASNSTQRKLDEVRLRAELTEQQNRLRVARLKGRTIAARGKQIASRLMTAGSSGFGYGNATRSRGRDDARPRGGSAASHMQPYVLRELRRACQDLDRNNPLARALVSRTADMVCGNGFGLQVQSADTAWNTAVEAWWGRWAERAGDERGADVTGRHTLSHLVHEAFRGGCLVEGDVSLLKTSSGQIQMIEAERIGNPNGANGNPGLMNGVELDDSGRPVAYHVSEWAPYGQMFSQSVTRRIPAQSVIMLTNPMRMRTGQVRGEPAMAAVIDRFENLDQTSEAVRMSYFVAACQAMIVTTETPGIDQAIGAVEDDTDADTGNQVRYEDIQPGTIHHAGPNKKFTQFDPKSPSAAYDLLVQSEVTQIAADANLPVFMLLLDFSKVNYSSARGGMVTAFRGFKRCQQYLVDTVWSPIFRWRVAMAIRRGEIPGYAAGYVPDGWDSHLFIPPPPPVLDILVEMQASELAVRAGIKTRQQMWMELDGGDYDANIARLEFEKKDMDTRGLDFASTGPNGGAAKESTSTDKADGTEVGGGKKAA